MLYPLANRSDLKEFKHKETTMPATNSTSVPEITNDEAVNGATDAFQVIDVTGDVVTLHGFHIRNHDVAAYLIELPPEERPLALTRAVEVGVFCLERASNAKDTDFFKRQVERLLHDVETHVGLIPARVHDELLKKVGTGDGQVLKPVVDATGLVSKMVAERLAEVKLLFTEQLDPEKGSSSLGKALNALNELLDPARKDSVQGAVETVISKVTAEDGALAKSVKTVVAEAIKPLKEEVDSLAKEIRGDEAAKEALMQTTEKGEPYEIEVVTALQPWAKAAGAELEHVGGDNRPGDVVVKMTSSSITGSALCLVIEARDRTSSLARKAVSDDLTRKMTERAANAAIYLSRTAAGLGKELGDWAEGENDHGPWVATTHPHLHTAVRFLITLHRLRSLKAESPEFDGSAIENQIQRIRTALKRVKNIKTKVTAVRGSADDIELEATGIQEEIREALIAIEDAMRPAATAAP